MAFLKQRTPAGELVLTARHFAMPDRLVAAPDKALALRRPFGDRGLEELGLQYPLLEPRPDLSIGQRGEVLPALGRERLLGLAPVCDEPYPLNPDWFLEHSHRLGHRAGVGRIALKHPHGEGLAIVCRQQPDDNVRLAPLAIAVVAISGELIVLALPVA